MEQINYKKAATYYMIGTLFNKGLSFITVPIFTRLLTTSDYGIISTYNSWTAILASLMGLAMPNGLRMAFIDYKDKIDDVNSVLTTFSLVFAVLVSSIIFIVSYFIRVNLDITLIGVCLINTIAMIIISNYIMYLEMQYRYKFRTALMVLPGLLSTIISIIVIKLVLKNQLYLGRIVPSAGISCIIAAFILFLIYKRSHVLFSKEYVKYALAISVPLIFHSIALDILSQSDRVMIAKFANTSQAGIYSLIFSYGSLATVITIGFSGVWNPWFFHNMKEKESERINEKSNDYILLITYAMMGLILIGPEIVHLLASEPFWEGIKIIPTVVLANYLIFMYSFYVGIEHFNKKTIRITINTIISAVCNLLLNYIFIKRFGYIGAAFTTVASYFICFFLHFICSRKLSKELFPVKSFLLPILELGAIVVLFYILIDFTIARISLLIIITSLYVVIYRKKIICYFPFVLEKIRKTK